MANQVDRITKVRIQPTQGRIEDQQPYAIGAEARYVTLESGSNVEDKIRELEKQSIIGITRINNVLYTTRADGAVSSLTIWNKNTANASGAVSATGGTSNVGKVWKVGKDGQPSWAVQDKTKVSELPAFKPASSTAAGVQGLVPAPKKNQQSCFLRGDGKWVVPTGALKNAIGQAGYVNATTTAANYYNSFWSVGHVPAGTGTTQTNFPAWRRNAVCFVGAKNTANGYAGLVPAPLKGQESLFLQGNGKWGNPSKGIWKPNKINEQGYVTAPGTDARSQFWGVDKTGKLGWTNFNNITIQGDNVIFAGNGRNDTFLRGDGQWTSINAVLNGKVDTKLVMADSKEFDVNKNLLLTLNDGKGGSTQNGWKLFTLNGTNMKGYYMAIANVSVDTAHSNKAFPSVSSQNPYIATVPLDGYLRAVLNITKDDNMPVLNNDIFGRAPSQNTITKYGGSVTTCYEWFYDGNAIQHIYLAARYYALTKLNLCYNVIILKLS